MSEVENLLVIKGQNVKGLDELAFLEKMRELIAFSRKSEMSSALLMQIAELILKQKVNKFSPSIPEKKTRQGW